MDAQESSKGSQTPAAPKNGLSEADALLLEGAWATSTSTQTPGSDAPAKTESKNAPVSTLSALYQPGTDPWVNFVAHDRKMRPLLASILENGSPLQGSFLPTPEGELSLAFRPSEAFYRDQLQARAYHEQMMALGREFFGRTVRFKIELQETGETLADKKERAKVSREEEARAAVRNHPIIAEARSLFGGEVSNLVIKEGDGSGGAP
jgi:hypothetical protein